MLLADDVVELHPRAAAVGAEPVVLAGFEVWQIWFSKCLKVLVFLDRRLSSSRLTKAAACLCAALVEDVTLSHFGASIALEVITRLSLCYVKAGNAGYSEGMRALGQN